MKMILAIINKDDANSVISNLTKQAFSVTKLATTGGFLMSGNTTIITGVPDEKVDQVIEVISKYSRSRKQAMPSSTDMGGMGFYPTMPVEITVGGATIFVMPIDRFEKV